GGGHVELRHAQGLERVENRIDHRWRLTDGTGFAAALCAQGVVGSGGADGIDLELGEVVVAWHCVVHERGGEQLDGLGVVDEVLQQRLTNPLHDATVHLALHDHRVDDGAEVVHRAELVHTGEAGGRVHLHFADVGAGGEGEVGRV